jgi:5'-nucleotidase
MKIGAAARKAFHGNAMNSPLLMLGVTSRSLFDLEDEDRVFHAAGTDAYIATCVDRETVMPAPGTAMPLARAITALNRRFARPLVGITLISRNAPEQGLRLMHAADHYDLDIERWAFTGGTPVAPLLNGFHIDLFLSRHPQDAADAIVAGVPAALPAELAPSGLSSGAEGDSTGALRPPPPAGLAAPAGGRPLFFAFDGDAVLFDGESEEIFREQGRAAFDAHEKANADRPLAAGPFARVLQALARLQALGTPDNPTLSTAIVTARGAPAHERVLTTLTAWHIHVDQLYMLGGLPKTELLASLNPDIYFDDQARHIDAASPHIPCALVPPVAPGGTTLPALDGAGDEAEPHPK